MGGSGQSTPTSRMPPEPQPPSASPHTEGRCAQRTPPTTLGATQLQVPPPVLTFRFKGHAPPKGHPKPQTPCEGRGPVSQEISPSRAGPPGGGQQSRTGGKGTPGRGEPWLAGGSDRPVGTVQAGSILLGPRSPWGTKPGDTPPVSGGLWRPQPQPQRRGHTRPAGLSPPLAPAGAGFLEGGLRPAPRGCQCPGLP